MKQMWKKDDPNHLGDSWYSHKEGTGWCNGKPAKPQTQNGLQSQALTSLILSVNKVLEGQLEIKQLLASLGAKNPVAPNNDNKVLPF